MRQFQRLAGLAVVLMALQAGAEAAPSRLESARQLVVDNKLADAAKAVDAALAAPGNDEATVQGLLELSGIVATQQKQAAKAKLAFEKLLLLNPGYKLNGKQPPKVVAAFNEARKTVTRRGGGLKVEQLTPELKGGLVVAVYFGLEGDYLRLVRKVRVHARGDAGAWTVQEQPAATKMKADISGKQVEWWLECLGERGEVLAHLGSEGSPIVDRIPGLQPPAPKPTATAAAPELTPSPKAAQEPVVSAATPATTSSARKPRIVPWVLWGLAAIGTGTGAYFGANSQALRSSVADAPTDSSGVVSSMTRAQALERSQQAQSQALIANSAFGAAAGLAVTGAVVWLVGGQEGGSR